LSAKHQGYIVPLFGEVVYIQLVGSNRLGSLERIDRIKR
jgi:hypothetical protein